MPQRDVKKFLIVLIRRVKKRPVLLAYSITDQDVTNRDHLRAILNYEDDRSSDRFLRLSLSEKDAASLEGILRPMDGNVFAAEEKLTSLLNVGMRIAELCSAR